MKTSVKVTLIVIVSFVLIAISGGVYWYKYEYSKLVQATKNGIILGTVYGRTVKQSNCVTSLKLQYSKCDTFKCEFSATGFITGCMKTAEKDNFCSEIPKTNQTRKVIDWTENTCEENNLGNTKCHRYMQKFVSLCTEQVENRKKSLTEHFTDGFKTQFTRDTDKTYKEVKKRLE